MSSQERFLQLKRIPLDKWSTREQLCLASAVACSGDQNWMSVSRSLKMICGNDDRPNDWFSQKFCAAQYGKLLENVETPKRKKRTATERDSCSSVVTPGESIVRKLTEERISELKRVLEEEEREYQQLKDEIQALQSTEVDESQLRAMWTQIELEKLEKEKEQLQYDKWLKEREERKLEMERAWRPSALHHQNLNSMSPTSNSNSSNSPSRNSPSHISIKNQPPSLIINTSLKIKQEDLEMDDTTSSSSATSFKQGTSPLLTSLLKSPSSQHHQTQTTSSSSTTTSAVSQQPSNAGQLRTVVAPTITNLLTGQVAATNSIPSSSPSASSPALANLSFQSHFQFHQHHHPSPPLLLVQSTATPSQAAPTLSKLLDRKAVETNSSNSASVAAVKIEMAEKREEEQQLQVKREMVDHQDTIIDDDQQLMEVFKELIPDDLTDILTDNNEMNMVQDDMLEEESILEQVDDDLVPEPVAEVKEEAEEESVIPEEQPEVIDEIPEQQNDEPEEVIDEFQDPSIILESTEEIPVEPETTTDEPEIILDLELDEQNEEVEEVHQPEQQSFPENVETVEQEEEEVQPQETETPELEEAETVIEIDSKENTPPLTVEQEVEEIEPQVVDVIEESNPAEIKVEEVVQETEAEKIEERKASTDVEDHFEDAKSTLDESGPIEVEEEEEKPKLSPKKEPKPEPIQMESDYDSPMEVVVKEEKTIKNKKEYHRLTRELMELKKMEDSGEETRSISLRMRLKDRDRSESPLVTDDDTSDIPRTRRRYSSTPVIDSVPSSPASGDDRDYKNWKKSVLIAYNRFFTLYFKYSAILIQQVPEEFRHIILKPMDMQTIKRNIETGVTRTNTEFLRDILLMVQNAIMMNTRKDKDWLNLFKEMMHEVDYWRRETEKNFSLSNTSNGSSSSNNKDRSRKRKK